MVDTPKLTTNQFIKEHVTDELYKTIVAELTTREKGNKTGKKLGLTVDMLRQFLFYVSIGEDLKNAAELVQMNENTRQDYNKRSATFSRVTSLAKNNLTLRSKIAVYKAIEGQLPQYYEITNPETQQKKYIELKEIPPNVAVAQWHLEKVNAYGNEGKDDQPQLGAPQNEKEAELLLLIMNKHSDYVESKRKQLK